MNESQDSQDMREIEQEALEWRDEQDRHRDPSLKKKTRLDRILEREDRFPWTM